MTEEERLAIKERRERALESLQGTVADYNERRRREIASSLDPTWLAGGFSTAKATGTNGPGPPAGPAPVQSRGPLSYGAGRVSAFQGGLIISLMEDQWVYGGFWVQVSSSNVAAIAYDIELQQLYVQFRNGSTYRYSGASEMLARDMFRASSCGKFVWQRLRDKLAFTKL